MMEPKKLKKPGESYMKDREAKKAEIEEEQKNKESKADKKRQEKKSRSPLAVGVMVLVLLIAVGALAWFFVQAGKPSKKEQLTEDLEVLGRDFYESYYYEQISALYEDPSKMKSFLDKYSATGINVNLDNLGRYESKNLENKILTEGFINDKTDELCDKEQTKIFVYPEEPFGRTDYRIETTLVCGFGE